MPRAPSLWLSTVSAATSPASPLSIGDHRDRSPGPLSMPKHSTSLPRRSRAAGRGGELGLATFDIAQPPLAVLLEGDRVVGRGRRGGCRLGGSGGLGGGLGRLARQPQTGGNRGGSGEKHPFHRVSPGEWGAR